MEENTEHFNKCVCVEMSCVDTSPPSDQQVHGGEGCALGLDVIRAYISELPCSEQALNSCLLNAFNSPVGIKIRHLIILSRTA